MSSSALTSLKLSFNGEIRRLTVTPSGLTYDLLMEKTLSVFPHLTAIRFSWVDDEGDKVVISSDDELSEALRVMTGENKGYLRFEVLNQPTSGDNQAQLDGRSAASNKSPASSTSSSNDVSESFGTITHENVVCDGCGKTPIVGSRFKCAVRQDYDLCHSCEASTQPYPMVKIYRPDQVPAGIMVVVDERHIHKKHGKPFGGPKGAALCHRGIVCDGCNIRNFHGPRFKCTVRNDFDLCEACEVKDSHDHPMVKIYPQHANTKVEVLPSISILNDLSGAEFKLHERLVDTDGRGVHHFCGPHTHHGPPGRHGPPAHHAPPGHHGPGHQGRPSHGPHHGPHHHGPHGPRHGRCNWRRRDCWDRGISLAKAAAAAAAKKEQLEKSEQSRLEEELLEESRLEDELLDMCIQESLLEEKHQNVETNSMETSSSSRDERQKKINDWRNTIPKRNVWTTGTFVAEAAAERAKQHAALMEKQAQQHKEKEQTILEGEMVEMCKKNSLDTIPVGNSNAHNDSSMNEKGEDIKLSDARPPSKLMARFVRDMTMPDGSEVAPCSTFLKSWRVRNDGQRDWPEGCHLINAGGDNLLHSKDEELRKPVPAVVAGEEVVLSVELRAPPVTGRYVGYFRLQNPNGGYFGQRLWADIRVNDADLSVSMTMTPWEIIESSSENEEEKADSSHEELNDDQKNENHDNFSETFDQVTVDESNVVESQNEDDLQEDVTTDQIKQQDFDSDLTVWSTELGILAAMGFTDVTVILPLLKEHINVPSSQREEGSNGQYSESGLQAVVLTLLSEA